MITSATFRADYPEFASLSLYPIPAFAYWNVVANLLLTSRWGAGSLTASSPPTTIYDVAAELFVAHNLALEKTAQDAAKRGATPGISKGPIASDSVGSVSRSYSVADGLVEGAGHWNLTIYGTRLMWLMQMFGAGPVQVGVGFDPYGFGGFYPNGSPWVGPPPWPGEFSFG